MNKCLCNLKIIRKFADEFRREGEMMMAPVQTTPNPSSLGFAACY